MRHILTIPQVGADNLARLVKRAVEFAADSTIGSESLRDRIVGIFFRKTSTRTRSSFTVGALKLGGKVIAYGPNDLQTTTGETLEDTVRVLSGYLDLLVIRTNESLGEIETFASQQEMGIVNALTEDDHPTQAVADLSTLLEAFGHLDGLHVLYFGVGNSTAISLAQAAALTPGMKVTLVTPAGLELPSQYVGPILEAAERHGSTIAQQNDLENLPTGVDAVYTSRWKTMGVAPRTDDWDRRLAPYRVTQEIMDRVSKPETIFLHDLPAMRGEDVTDEVLDGPRSLAWRQAEHKMFSAMSILEWCAQRA